MIGNCRQSCGTISAAGILILVLGIVPALADEPRATGPETERRFPPLQVPDGFRATLFACDPLVEYPSVIALGPEAGTLFVAHDYVTGLGVEIVRRDEIRLVADTDGDGYADRSTVYASEFNSIQGLAYHAGRLFVMHAPLLTSLADLDGDGVADRRQDLLEGLGLPPEENPNRLHCANGVVAGHDGWLYLALGDRGCDVRRVEGDRLLLQEGGILRCRPDGRDLHVFASGLRNIYDVALDEQLNVFVRDNENDGGDYMIRVCHCFHGSDHGYPYLYDERPEEAMPPLADLGRGSSAGGTAYLEMAFPSEYRKSLFFCEWGRAVVRYRKQRAGSSFVPMEEVDFASGAPDDPYGFKPTDVVVDRDGSLLISDWCDGQRPKRGRGRIYRITFPAASPKSVEPHDVAPDAELDQLLTLLDADRYCLRVTAQQLIEQRGPSGVEAVQQAIEARQLGPLGRMHAVWIFAHLRGEEAVDKLLQLAEQDPEVQVRAQSVRAVADLTDPVLQTHRLAAGRGNTAICERLARLAEHADPRLGLEVLVALSRLGWPVAPDWLRRNWTESDPALNHAAMQLLRRSGNWEAVLTLLDGDPNSAVVHPSLRTLALRALADRTDETIVDGVLARLKEEASPHRRIEYVDVLARIYKKPAEWTYWGFRPAPRPANSVAWQYSERIAAVFDRALQEPDTGVRTFALRRMLREAIPIKDETLADWLARETDAAAVAAILEALSTRPPAQTRAQLEFIIGSEQHATENRLRALAMFAKGLDETTENRLLDFASSLDHGAVLAEVLRQLSERPDIDATSLLLNCLDSPRDEVRAAAAESLVKRPVDAVAPRVTRLLQDPDIRVRRAAAVLAGRLNVRAAVDPLLDAADHSDLALRGASLEALTALREPAAVPFAAAACDFPETQLAALACLAAMGGPQHLDPVTNAAQRSRSTDVLAASVRTLLSWQEKVTRGSSDWLSLERTVATIQATSGVPVVWHVQSVDSTEAIEQLLRTLGDPAQSDSESIRSDEWSAKIVEGADTQIRLDEAKDNPGDSFRLAMTDLYFDAPHEVQCFSSADGSLRVWLNGREIFQREKSNSYEADAERFDANLAAGMNRLLVQVVSDQQVARFQLRFRRKSSKADHERITRLALDGQGNAERGREVFVSEQKSQCIKCHRIGEQGARIGPDLAGIGSRFSRIHLVESILEPSRAVAPSYETVAIALDSGLVLTGVKITETEDTLTLGDDQGKPHEIPKAGIDAIQPQPRSTMPDGLEKRLTDREFVDLIGYLLSLKKSQSQ